MSRRLELSLFKTIAIERGGACLSTDYVDSKSKLRWRCAEGHTWDATPGKMRSGQWCPKCSRIGNGGNSIAVNGKTYPSVLQASVAFGIDYGCITYRLNAGWSVNEAFGIAERRSARTGKQYRIDSLVFSSIAEAAKHFQVAANLVRQRLRSNWSLPEALQLEPRRRRNPSKGKPVKVQDRVFPSVSEAAEHFGIEAAKAANRLRDGWTPEQAFGLAPGPRRRREYQDYEEIDGRIFPRASHGEYKLYVITNLLNAKEYVGITLGSLEKRWGEHLSMGPNFVDTKLKRAIRKHGADHFRMTLLRNNAQTYRQLMEQEKAEIARRRTYEDGYNSTRGGELVFNARELRVGDKIFPTLASAAAFHGIEEWLIRARLDAMGWSVEEAVGIKERPTNKYAPRGELVVNGQSFPSHKAAAAHFGVGFKKYSLRLTRYGWTPEQALNLAPPPRGAWRTGMPVFVNRKQFASISAAAKYFGINSSVAAARLRKGWPEDRAFGITKK